MEEKQTAVEWYFDKIKSHFEHDGDLFESHLFTYSLAKKMEKERASTFGIRVTSECCSIKNGKMEVDLHKFETLLNEMYGTKNSD